MLTERKLTEREVESREVVLKGLLKNKRNLAELHRRFPGRLTVRAPAGATPLYLLSAAVGASRLKDLHVRVTTRRQRERSVSTWDELRTWDPGD